MAHMLAVDAGIFVLAFLLGMWVQHRYRDQLYFLFRDLW